MDNALRIDIDRIARIDAVPRMLEIASRKTGMRFVAVARVTEDRWMACAVRDAINFGLEPGGELEIGTTICNEIRQSGKLVVIDHVSKDKNFCAHPTPAQYGFQSYISVPILLPDGAFFGTLCAIDPDPVRLNNPETIGMFEMFAELIGFQLDAQDKLATSETALMDARESAELREQFIAVLGHDLRNPLAAVSAGIGLLARKPAPAQQARILDQMTNSVSRMAGLVDDILDFARGRLGGGIPAVRTPQDDLGEALMTVVDEFRVSYPGRTIDARIDVDSPVYCDAARIAQLLSNLLANALAHGDPASPTGVVATVEKGTFELAVSNKGSPIDGLARARLFKPFERARDGQKETGLGLGLYIASEVAKAHGGTLDFESDDTGTCFTFYMPAERRSKVRAGAARDTKALCGEASGAVH